MKQTHALLTPLLDWLFSEPLLNLSHDPDVIQSTLGICSFACDQNEFLVINLVWKNLLRFATALSSQKLIDGECMTLILRSLFVNGFGHLQRSYSVETDANAKRFAVLCEIFSKHVRESNSSKFFNEAKFYLGLLNNIIKLFPHDTTSTDADLENICQMIAFSRYWNYTGLRLQGKHTDIIQHSLFH